MEEREWLARFEQGDRDAFERLCERARRALRSYLQKKSAFALGLLSAEDREDLIQTVLLKIWGRPFSNRGVAAWYQYLQKTADFTYVDMVRARRKETPVEEPEERRETDEALQAAEELIESLHQAMLQGSLQEQADLELLGLDSSLTPAQRTRLLLLAQYVYLDGLTWEEIETLLPPAAPGETTLTRETADEWLPHAGTLRSLAYHELYYSNDALTCHLLGWEEGRRSGALDACERMACAALTGDPPTDPPPAGWTWQEVALLFWRYRHALHLEQITQRQDCPFSPEEIQTILVRTASLLPFKKRMQKLLTCLRRANVRSAPEILGMPGLWQRLAFQYRYADDLPLRDIQERTAPAAETVNYEVKLTNLNVWLSGGRLLRRVARRGLVGEEVFSHE